MPGWWLAMACASPPEGAQTALSPPYVPSPPPAAEPGGPVVCGRSLDIQPAEALTDAVERLRTHDVLAVGEAHGLGGQIVFAAELIQAAAGAGLVFDVAMELLPSSAQPLLDAMDPSVPDEAWWTVVAQRTWPVPLVIEEYAAPVKAARRAGSRAIGLSPPCDLGATGSRERSIACLANRDATMAAIATREVLEKGRKLILLVGYRHAAKVLAYSDGTPVPTTAGLLAAQHSTASILLAGPVQPGPSGEWVRTCGGFFDMLGLARRSATDLAGLGLSYRCVDPDGEYAPGPLEAAFDAAVWLRRPGGPATPLGPEAYQAMGPRALSEWNRFGTELMGEPDRSPADWFALGAEQAEAWSRLELVPVDYCSGAYDLP